jgi:hypothetical protein
MDTSVSITDLATDKEAYEPGEMVLMNLGLSNSGTEQDICVSAQVLLLATGDFVDGLLLKTLKSLQGDGSISLQWDSSPFDPGQYYAVVILRDLEGNLLAKKMVMFRLGIPAAEIDNFTVTPDHFELGDQVYTTFRVVNTGSTDLNGTAVVKIHDRSGEVVHEYTQEVSAFSPHEVMDIEDIWETGEMEGGVFSVVSYFLYEGTATVPKTSIISTSSCLADKDHDGDVDGSDLAEYLQYSGDMTAAVFSADFGRMNCIE